ncbi:MAG: TlpA family protein disulfide reductase [Paludibacter sp.]
MKKLLKYMLGIALLAIGSWLVVHTWQAYRAKKETGKRVETLQNCGFESLDGQTVYVDEFDPKKPTVIIYFNPECEHCQYEASEIGTHSDQFEKANMILITPDDSIKRVEDFAKQHHLWKVDNLTILIDRGQKFKSYFGTSSFPTVFIYGPDKKLRKIYKGETKTEAIINSIY